MSNHSKAVFLWVSDLADLCARGADAAEAKSRIKIMVEALAADFPRTTTFLNPGSLVYVARASTFFPSFAEMRRLLIEWEEANVLPDTPPLLSDDYGGLDQTGISFVRAWRAACAGSPVGNILPGSRLALTRRHHDAAYRYLLDNDTRAASIARERGWEVDGAALSDPAEVTAAVKAAIASMEPARAANVKADASRPGLEAIERKLGRPVGSVSPEALKLIREQAQRTRARELAFR